MNAQPRPPADCLAAALEYAGRGWQMFPAPPGTKKSYVSGKRGNGKRWGATSDTELIQDYWSKFPKANVGIACGPLSGLFVVECDTPEGHDVDGIASMENLLATHGPLPDTIEALSPTGSWHIYFRWPDAEVVKNSASKIAPGIDVRGEGGMVIGVPSVKPGKPQTYCWKNPPGLFDLADCPDWLLKLCAGPKDKKASADAGPRFDFNDTASNAGSAEVEELLSWIDPDAGGYHQWIDVLMSLHDHFGGSVEGLCLRRHGVAEGRNTTLAKLQRNGKGSSPARARGLPHWPTWRGGTAQTCPRLQNGISGGV